MGEMGGRMGGMGGPDMGGMMGGMGGMGGGGGGMNWGGLGKLVSGMQGAQQSTGGNASYEDLQNQCALCPRHEAHVCCLLLQSAASCIKPSKHHALVLLGRQHAFIDQRSHVMDKGG